MLGESVERMIARTHAFFTSKAGRKHAKNIFSMYILPSKERERCYDIIHLCTAEVIYGKTKQNIKDFTKTVFIAQIR